METFGVARRSLSRTRTRRGIDTNRTKRAKRRASAGARGARTFDSGAHAIICKLY
jgi:hypothetical protein